MESSRVERSNWRDLLKPNIKNLLNGWRQTGWRPIKWDPSVRTRHLAVTIFLITLVALVLLSFNTARYLNGEIRARGEDVEKLFLDPLSGFIQEAIYTRPLEPPKVSISLDESVRSLIKASTIERSDLAYCAIIALDGQVLSISDPKEQLQDRTRIKQFNDLLQGRWYSQLWQLYRQDYVYEITIIFRLSGDPFARLVVGIPAERFRSRLTPTLKLSLIFSMIVITLAILTALTSSNMVLWPLREVMESIEQLEAESALNSDTRYPETLDMQSMTQRLRELGRRFAGNRTEVEVIRDQLQQVVGSLTESVLLLDREQRVLMASPEAERLIGQVRGPVRGPLRGKSLSQILSPTHPLTQLTARAYRSGLSQQQRLTIAGSGDGLTKPQRVVASLQLFNDREQPAGALLTLRDLEALQQLESQLDFATKLAALNRITAGVAHEVKNPLHAMVLHLELLSGKLEAGLDPKAHVDILTTEVNRLKRVVQTFLDFTRPVEVNLEQVDANELVREVVELSADARAQGIDIVELYSSEPLPIKADHDLLKQALLNIIINGCQVMPNGGRLFLQTARENGQVLITITDEGPGIPQEIREKIFNLYFTTKPSGSGIGLSQAFRAVQLHNGQIQIISPPDRSASFQITLPVG
jgi:signal transduction histidine kinase